MKFEEMLHHLRQGKIITDGIHLFRMVSKIEFRMGYNDSWADTSEFSIEEVLGEMWEIAPEHVEEEE